VRSSANSASIPVAGGRLSPAAIAARHAVSRSSTARAARPRHHHHTAPVGVHDVPGDTVTPPHCTVTLIARGPVLDPVAGVRPAGERGKARLVDADDVADRTVDDQADEAEVEART
jgi:hypothetical protein